MKIKRIGNLFLLVIALNGCFESSHVAPSVPSGHAPALVKPDTSRAELLISQGALIIDVRSAEEYASDHYSGAINIPHTLITEKIASFKNDKTRPIVVYCKSGNRAEVAKQSLLKMGYANVVNGGGLNELRGE